MTPTLELHTLTDVGRHRSRNEDAVGSDPELGLLVVADGMGGHPAGNVASRLAVEAVLSTLREPRPSADGTEAAGDGDPGTGEARDRPSDSPPPDDVERGYPGDRGARMAEAVRRADARVRNEGLRNPERAGMGTTLTVLLLDLPDRRWTVGHVGDSRAYRLREGELELLTRDDTWVQEQVEAGRLDPAEARTHPYANVLSQALGVQDPVDPSVPRGDLRPGDLFLVCSDGLTTHLTDDRIHELLHEHREAGPERIARALVEEANREGGIDNITVGVARVSEDT